MKHYLLGQIISIVIWLLRQFPRDKRKLFATFCANLILKFAHKTRNRALANITNAMPNLSAAEAKSIVKISYQTIVFGVMECFWLDELPIDIECSESTLELLNSKCGVSIATMHMSCYELVPFAVQSLIGQATTLSKIPPFIKNATDIYHQANITVINKNQQHSLIKLLQTTKTNAAICLHADHYARDVDVTFFNRQTSAPSGPAAISAYSKSPLLIAYPILQSNNRYKVIIETLVDTHVGSTSGEINHAMQCIYHRFEEIISTNANQWYWSYNRWREVK